ncbi:hypothetical protein T484DRAFT_1879481, partial [Baffinella frigidus]
MQEGRRSLSPRPTPLGSIQLSLSNVSSATPSPFASPFASPPGGVCVPASHSSKAQAGVRLLVPARLSDAENDSAHAAGATKSVEMRSYPAARDSCGGAEAGSHVLLPKVKTTPLARESTGSSGPSLKITGLLEDLKRAQDERMRLQTGPLEQTYRKSISFLSPPQPRTPLQQRKAPASASDPQRTPLRDTPHAPTHTPPSASALPPPTTPLHDARPRRQQHHPPASAATSSVPPLALARGSMGSSQLDERGLSDPALERGAPLSAEPVLHGARAAGRSVSPFAEELRAVKLALEAATPGEGRRPGGSLGDLSEEREEEDQSVAVEREEEQDAREGGREEEGAGEEEGGARPAAVTEEGDGEEPARKEGGGACSAEQGREEAPQTLEPELTGRVAASPSAQDPSPEAGHSSADAGRISAEAGQDASPEAGLSNSPEVGHDARPEAGLNNSPEAGHEASPEAGHEASPEAGHEASPEAGPYSADAGPSGAAPLDLEGLESQHAPTDAEQVEEREERE